MMKKKMMTTTTTTMVDSNYSPVILLALVVVWSATADGQLYDCPRQWLENGKSCYTFVLRPLRTVQQAEIECLRQHSDLITVDDAAENTFVNNWLLSNDVGGRHDWLTSGKRRGGKFVWNSDESEIRNFFFPDDATKNEKRVDSRTDIEYRHIVYSYDAVNNIYEWNWGRTMKPMAYICEIQKKDLWKIYQRKRDFSFGNSVLDPYLWPVAPNITEISKDLVFIKRDSGEVTSIDVNCLATGNPPPIYRWFRTNPGLESVLLKGNSHITIINGRLFIQTPNIQTDSGTYYCEASNQHGTVISNDIQVSYGKLDEFSNVKPGDYSSKLYMGIEIDCQPPNYKPDASFTWFKGSVLTFIRPSLNPQMFLSRNGKLYISEVSAADAGDYFCAVFLEANPGARLSSQTVSRNSMAITLTVQGDTANTYGPDIQDRFPQVFPRIPMVGQRMVLECLAYGRLPLRYRWARSDGPMMNPTAYTTDSGRVLVIEEALLGDSGAYTCMVDGIKSSSNRTRYIKLSGMPSFPLPLENQFLDSGSAYTWSCLAQGIPVPTYSWYKDGKRLTASEDELGITVRGRHLMFKSVSDKNNGAYECVASNTLGSRRSSAQVRAVSFPPTFEHSPVTAAPHGTQGGTVAIKCTPEGAPRPSIVWRRGGGVGLPGNSRVLPTGTLELTDLGPGNAGTYVCEATNSLGAAESTAQLTIIDKTILLESPEDDVITINGTTTMLCKASYDQAKSDVTYSWKFFNHEIHLERDIAYSMPYLEDGAGTLYVLSAQYEHQGIYTCIVSTTNDKVEASAYLTVEGPPEPPTGLHRCRVCSQRSTSIELRWLPGRLHKYPVTHYVIEAHSDLDGDDTWTIVRDDVNEEDSKVTDDSVYEWRMAMISSGLSPGASYNFRIRAGTSGVGYSPPSQPSPSYEMLEAAPIYPPPGIGGGGGSVRELRIIWKPLPRSQWGSNSIRYKVYYRLEEDNGRLYNRKWEESEELHTTEFHTVVNAQYFYTPYEVKVQAINDKGPGPNSTVVIVLSAENMPTFVPSFNQANAINATAGTVEWNRVSDTRKVVKGAIFAFQVNYWLEDTKCIGRLESTARFTRVYGDVTSANVIGLEPGADYCVNIQMLNHAGLGPKTENYYLGMNDPAPGRYPEYVYIMSHGEESVVVTWRGLVNQFGESPLQGYKAWYWKLQEDIRSAKKVDFGRSFRGIIRGIEMDEIYRLRMVGYNAGGDGKKAPDIMFTLGGMVNYNPLTTEIMNKAQRQLASQFTMLITMIVLLFNFYS